jgi:hypothetical protein
MLALLRSALATGDLDEALDSALDLYSWVWKGGFPPSDPEYRKDIDTVFAMIDITVAWDTVDRLNRPILLPPSD